MERLTMHNGYRIRSVLDLGIFDNIRFIVERLFYYEDSVEKGLLVFRNPEESEPPVNNP